jgi:hypothetical protein
MTGVGIRRYKAFKGRPGYLEACYRALPDRHYTVRAPYPWTEAWRHVALLWDMEKRRIEIYIDGELKSDSTRTNGKDTMDKVWYGAPFTCGLRDQAQQIIVLPTDEGGRSATRRDEFYVYNRALTIEEIRANMKSAMGKVCTPTIAPGATSFHDTLTVRIENFWSSPIHRYTLDGSDPSESSPEYKTPIVLDKSASLKVRAYLKGYAPSDIVTAEFKSLGPDRKKPRVKRVLSINDPKQIIVVFDKDMDPDSAGNTANYALSGNIKVAAATLGTAGRTVRLQTEAPLVNGKHTVSIRSVKDASRNGNVIEGTDLKIRRISLPGLVRWWSFDVLDDYRLKDFGPQDAYARAYREVCTRKATRVEGYKGKALAFPYEGDFADLTPYLKDIPSTNMDDWKMHIDPDAPVSSDSGTISLWMKADKGHGGCILNKKYAYGLSVSGSKSILRGGLRGGSFGRRRGPRLVVADGKWHHIAIAYKDKVKNEGKVYVDGKRIFTCSMNARGLKSRQLYLSLPRGWGGFSSRFGGVVDEVMVFNRQLNDEEIAQLFKEGEL